MDWKTFEQRIREEEVTRHMHELEGRRYTPKMPKRPTTPKPLVSTYIGDLTWEHVQELISTDDALIEDRLRSTNSD